MVTILWGGVCECRSLCKPIIRRFRDVRRMHVRDKRRLVEVMLQTRGGTTHYPRTVESLTAEEEVQREQRDVLDKVRGPGRRSLAFAYELELRELPRDELDAEFHREIAKSESGSLDESEAQSTEDEQQQVWLIKRAGGNRWRCGLENDLKLVNGTEGFEDLRYAVLRNGEPCDPLEYSAISVSDIETAGALKYHTAPDAIDSRTRSAIRDKIEDLETAREIAHEQGAIEAEQNADEELAKQGK